MMQEGRYKSYFNFLEGEGNDIKNLNMVVQGKEKGSQEEKNGILTEDRLKGFRASLVAQLVKNVPAVWETWI